MRTVATKVDNSMHEQVISRCNSLVCNPSEHIRNLIKKDLDISDIDSKSSNIIAARRSFPLTASTIAAIPNSQKISKLIFEQELDPGGLERSNHLLKASISKMTKIFYEVKENSYCSRCKIGYTQ